MVHQIPRALEVVKPKLLEQLQAFGEQRDFITEDLNRSVVGEVSIRPLTEEERDEVLEAFGKLPNPLARFL